MPTRQRRMIMSEKYQLILRILVVLGVFLLYNSGKLQGEAAFGLIVIIVSSVFDKTRK